MVSAAGNSNFGYWNGGSHGSRVGRLDYANDSVNAVFRGNTTFAGVKRGGTGSGSFGYMTGGDPSSVTIVDRVDYSNDTSIAAKGPLSLGKYYHAAVSAQENGLATNPIPATRIEARPAPAGTDYGYIGGGHDSSGRLSSIDRIDIANDTATALVKGKMTVQRRGHAGTGSLTHGYQGGDDVPGSKSSVSRIDFSNDTADAAVVGRMSFASPGGAAASGNKDFGYFVGGSGNLTNVSRVDYSNDSATQSPKGPLAAGMWYLGGTGNQSFGYFVGGYPAISTLNRIDYGNDTATAATKGNQSTGRYGQGASGNASYAYFAGGRASSVLSTVDRLDYSNDTPNMVAKGPLSSTGYYISSFGNSEYGWFCARRPDKSVVDRIDFANDTATASIRGPLTATRKYAAASSPRQFNNPTTSAPTVTVDKGADGYTTTSLGPAFGYAVGGYASSNPRPRSTVDRIDYANDTATASVKGSLDEDYFAHQSTSNLTHAYAASGDHAGTSVSRIEFSNDTATAVAKGPLTSVHNYFGATGNTSFGYYAGGESSPSPAVSTVDRIDYSNDTATASTKGPLSFAKKHSQACGNMSFGYWAGAGYPDKSSVDRVDYSSDTSTASPKGNLEYGRSTMVASGTSDFGYWSGGFPYYTKASRIEYANDTATAVAKVPYPSAVSPYGFSNAAGTGSSTHGYAFGGNGYNTYVWRFEYANDTTNASPKGPLSEGRIRFSGASGQENGMASTNFIPRIRWVDNVSEGTPVTQGPAFGYFGGGSYPSVSNYSSSVDRINYGNDTAIAAPKGNLSRTTQNHGGASSRTGGYYFGRFPAVSTVDRIDFDNDTATAAAKGNLTLARGYTASTGNNDFGYTGGGYTGSPVSTIDRLDYSNDTTNTVEKGPLSVARYGLAATGNQSFGYIVGGQGKSTVDRVDYSSDTGTATPKGPLSAGIRYMTATGNANFGYVSRGYSPSFATFIYRIDYSNDTATTSVRGPLAAGATYRGATSSSDFGYFSGGQNPSSAVRSEISRIDYSNDTATAVLKGNLSIAKNKHAGTSSRSHGLPSPQPTIAAPVQPPFPFPTPLPTPPPPAPVPYSFDHESATSITGTIGGQSRTGTYCDPETDLATGITYGSQDSTPFDTSTDRNSEIIRCYSFTNYSGRTFAAAICALCEKPPQGGVWPISNNWESAWWIQSGNDESDILIVVFDSVKTFSGVEISSPARQYSSSNDGVYVVRLSGSASSFTTDAIGDAVYDGSTTNTISASFSAQAIAIYRSGTGGWARVGNIRFLK